MSLFNNTRWERANKMTESCTNKKVQEKTFCEHQINSSSEINISQRNSFSKDHVMESILLPLDLTESGCERSCYKKMLGSDDYDSPMDITNKCGDNSNSHSASDVATSLFSKDAAEIHSSPPSLSDSSTAVKRSMSSAFMISSLLSTKTVSSFSTVLSQACSTSSFVPIMSSCISRKSEDGHNSNNFLADSVNKLDKLEASSKSGLLKESSQENINGEKLDVPQEELLLVDISAEADDIQGSTTSKNINRPATNNDNFLTMSDSEMDIQMAENDSGASVKEIAVKKTADEKTVSFCDSDSHNTSNSCALSECVESNYMESEDLADDVLVIDDSAHTSRGGRSQGPGTTDLDPLNFKMINRRASIVGDSADLTRDIVKKEPDPFDEYKERRASQQSSPVNFSENLSSQKHMPANNSDKIKHLSNSVDNCDVEYSDNLDQKQPRPDYRNTESRTDIDNRLSEKNIVKNLVKVPSEDSKYSLYGVCESRDFNKSHSFRDGNNTSAVLSVESGSSQDEPISYVIQKTSEVSDLSTFPKYDKIEKSSVCDKSDHVRVATHSTSVNDGNTIDHETNCSDPTKETKHGVNKLRSLAMKVDIDRLIKAPEKNACIKVEAFDKMEDGESLLEEQELLGNKSKKDDISAVGQVPCVKDTKKKNESVSSSVPKFSFKNILRMPKDKIVNCKKSSNIIEDSECLTPAKTYVHTKSLTTGSNLEGKVGDQQHAELKVVFDKNLKGDTSYTKMDVTETVQSNESASERKRFQSDESPSAPKRFKSDSMDIKEEKKTKDDVVIEVSDDAVVAEKSVASSDPTKQKNVSISNEALQSLITLRAKAYIKNQKQANLDRLNLRTRGMQSASNLWKETAKHLERSVLELAALNQKLESRKAHFLAVKRLASRSVGIQVGDETINIPGSVSNVQQTPSSNSTQRNSTLSTQSPVQRTHNRPGRPPLSSRLAITPTAALHEKKIQSPSGTSLDAQANSVNLIDLTDDEEFSKNGAATASSQAQSHPVNHKSAVGGKTPAPINGYVQPTLLLKGTSGSSLSPSNQTVSGSLFPPSGTADVQSQLVTTNNSPAQQASPVHTFVPGARTTANTNTTPGQSNISASPRALPQNSSPAVIPPTATASSKSAAISLPPSFLISNKHPAPLHSNMDTGNAPPTAKNRPPKPTLKISRVTQGIVLSWNMPSLSDVEKISTYQLYAYQESENTVPKSNLWKKVGEVKSLPLPMACTLTQFQEGNKYHFAVRAVDQFGRSGSYSDPSSIYLGAKA